MTYCGEQTFVKWNPSERQAASLRCRAWTCPDCEPQRKRQLIAQAHRGKPNTFLTITCRRGQFPTPEAAALALSNAWRLVAKRAVREAARDPEKRPKPAGPIPPAGWPSNASGRVPHQVRLPGGKLSYLTVIEAHESGWPHLHILTRSRWIAQAWLAAQMGELLNSPVVYVQRVTKASQVAGYVAKYCGKCAHKFGTAKRYWETQSWQLTKWERKQEPEGHWWESYRETITLREVAHRWTMQGWEVEFTSTTKIVGRPPP